MSILAAVAAKARNDEELLGEISEALLTVQVEAAGKSEAVGYSPGEVAASRQILAEFLDILAGVITHAEERHLMVAKSHKERAAANILATLDQQGEPLEYWRHEIIRTAQRLSRSGSIETSDWELLEQIVDLLDNELAQDLVALSKE